ncbi:hypothetical protein BDZ94DRAFT_739726, partial [Collybia nuda]
VQPIPTPVLPATPNIPATPLVHADPVSLPIEQSPVVPLHDNRNNNRHAPQHHTSHGQRTTDYSNENIMATGPEPRFYHQLSDHQGQPRNNESRDGGDRHGYHGFSRQWGYGDPQRIWGFQPHPYGMWGGVGDGSQRGGMGNRGMGMGNGGMANFYNGQPPQWAGYGDRRLHEGGTFHNMYQRGYHGMSEADEEEIGRYGFR